MNAIVILLHNYKRNKSKQTKKKTKKPANVGGLVPLMKSALNKKYSEYYVFEHIKTRTCSPARSANMEQ